MSVFWVVVSLGIIVLIIENRESGELGEVNKFISSKKKEVTIIIVLTSESSAVCFRIQKNIFM